jgi:hypothetical protein
LARCVEKKDISDSEGAIFRQSRNIAKHAWKYCASKSIHFQRFGAPSVLTPIGKGNAIASRQVAMEEFHPASRQTD